ncbi:hypothetical protein Tco_0985513 [Tanacetum coccineum]
MMTGSRYLKVVSKENANSDSEVEDVVDDHAVFIASTGLKRGDDSVIVVFSFEVIVFVILATAYVTG